MHHVAASLVVAKPVTHTHREGKHEATFGKRTRPVDRRGAIAMMKVHERLPRNGAVGETVNEKGSKDAGVIGAMHGPRQKKGRCEEVVVRRHGIQAPVR